MGITKISESKAARKDCKTIKNKSKNFKQEKTFLEKILEEGKEITYSEDLCPGAPRKVREQKRAIFRKRYIEIECPGAPKKKRKHTKLSDKTPITFTI